MPELLVEPPGSHLPPRAGLIKAQVDLLRVVAAVAAVVLALTSRGDVLVLGAALAVAAWRPWSAVAIAGAATAAGWRWGSTSLEALAGAQAVLGPAGWVGPGRGAASSWLAAIAVVVATPAAWRRGDPGRWARSPATVPLDRLVVAVAFGASAAAIVAGPALGGDLWVRVVATLVASAAAAGVLQARTSHPRAFDGAGLVAACASVALLAGEAPAWSGTVDRGALRSGAVVAVAVALLAAVARQAVGAMGRRQA